MTTFKKHYNKLGALVAAGMIAGYSSSASAAAAGGNNFGNIANNITTSISSLPGLLSAVAYLFGILIGVLGILKIKDHVENPTQTPLKDGAIRLAVGGALFALPIVYESMLNTVGSGSAAGTAKLNAVSFDTINTP